MTTEYEYEPVRGLPAPLPAGEKLLWQGSPDWRLLACRAFHVRKLAVYFALLVVWRIAAPLSDGATLASALLSGLWVLPLALGALAILAAFAWGIARTTVYTITNRRVVMRFGIAFPMALNLPFRMIGSAGLRTFRDGSGDIPLALTGNTRIAWLLLWPHARPWRVSHPEPMLRSIPDAARAAEILARALIAAQPVTAPQPVAANSSTAEWKPVAESALP